MWWRESEKTCNLNKGKGKHCANIWWVIKVEHEPTELGGEKGQIGHMGLHGAKSSAFRFLPLKQMQWVVQKGHSG